MKNEMMGENDLYLAPEETTAEAPADRAADAVPEAPAAKAVVAPEKVSRLDEIPEQRDVCCKVFRMADGTEQAVFSPAPIHVFDDETQAFEDMENTVAEDDDGKHFTCGGNRFIARFSTEEDTDELFSIQNGMHRITLNARRSKKALRHGVKPRLLKHLGESERPTDTLAYPDIENGTDYEYSVAGDGVKENIIVKQPAGTYRYPFTMQCENVTARYDGTEKRIAFISPESGEEVFYIPAPFMTDADGHVSTAVDYELRQAPRGTVLLTVTGPRVDERAGARLPCHHRPADQTVRRLCHADIQLGGGQSLRVRSAHDRRLPLRLSLRCKTDVYDAPFADSPP